MTPQQLNRDIKRLAKNCHTMEQQDVEKEFKRLYYADRSMQYLNANSIRMMLRLNLRYRVIALHYFGIEIDLPNEI